MKAILLLSLLAISFVVSNCKSYFRRDETADLIKVADQLLSLEVDQLMEIMEIMEILDNNLVDIQIQNIVHKKKKNKKPSKPKVLKV